MTDGIQTHYVKQYNANIELLLQESGGKLRHCAMMGPHEGEAAAPVDQFGKVEAQEVASRFAPINRTDPPTDRRWVYPRTFSLAQMIDKEDQLKKIADPQSKFVENSVKAFGRSEDDVLAAALFGTSKTGKSAEVDTVFDTGNTIAVSVGGAASGLNVAKLIAARKKLKENFVDFETEEIYLGISAAQDANLLSDIQITDVQFSGRPVLADGKIQSFLGFNFVEMERWPVDSSSYRRCPFWSKKGLYLGVWQDRVPDVSIRKDLEKHPLQLYDWTTIGATRLEEGRVGEILCAES